MHEEEKINRRNMLKMLAAAGFGSFAVSASATPGIGAMVPGKGWVKATGESCHGDGTPLQFIPKTAPDEKPLDDDLKKHPRCPYCGMSRTMWNHSRHLVQYDDDLVDGTCSIHCLAISLSLNIDRGAKAIYAADFSSDAEIKPLIDVDKATYVIGSDLKGTMSATSKMAFASVDAANAAQAKHGGTTGSFDEALREAYLGMANDSMMIRKRRLEKRKHMMKMKMQQKG